MTLGIRDTQEIDVVYNMRSEDVRNQARFDDSVGILPEFIDGYGILILPTTGRYFHLSSLFFSPLAKKLKDREG